MKFSIVVVCLNPGEKLNQTLDSILEQTYADYEIVVKDGGSRDGSIEKMRCDTRIHLFTEKDTGIYDAMNQAVSHATGNFILFLNCGDVFYSRTVLAEAAGYVCREVESSREARTDVVQNLVLYGDTYSEKSDVLISSAPQITGFTCYRNIPCHQSCFYAARLCREKPYNPEYRIRADYDHFLWCFYEAKAKMVHMKITVSSYEGGGFSESRDNKKRDKEEHRRITGNYMSGASLLGYRFLMLCTLAPFRSFLADNKHLSGAYHWIKEQIYGKRSR